MSKKHFRDMLKTTALIGGSSFIKIFIGMINTKFVAVLLGPTGVGLISTYANISNMVSTIAGMGMNRSGVRQIAEAVGTKDEIRIARTVKTLRHTVWITGSLGLLAMVVGCRWISSVTFGSPSHAPAIALLGSTILFANIATGQACILQGMRRITDLAKISIWGSVNGLIIGAPCFFILGIDGIIPSLILGSVASLCTSWWFARRISLHPVDNKWKDSVDEAKKILHLGLPMMAAGFVGDCPQYFIRILLIREIGIGGVGIWQSAFRLSGVLARFVLSAMTTDYYPRLTAVANDHKKVREEVNAQLELSLLLSVPGLAATIIFAPLVIHIFYSNKFIDAIEVLRWSVYGVFGQVISWPMGVIIAAFGRGKLLFFAEFVAAAVYILLIWLCVKSWGLIGTGIAYFMLYTFHVIFMMGISYYLCRMKLSFTNVSYILCFGIVLFLLGMICRNVHNPYLFWSVSISILVGLSFYCIHRLSEKSGIGLSSFIKRFSFKK